MSEYLDQAVVDVEVSALYENLLQDKEPEVRSEAVAKMAELCKYCSPSTLTEKILPIINAFTAHDNSQHVRGSLALSLCDMSKYIGKENTIKLIIPPAVQLLKDQATEVRVTLMQNLKTLTEVIGLEEFETHIIP